MEATARAGRKPRGRPPVTSRAEIVAAALDLARREGLEAVTIKGLAADMGVSPNTFYNHGTTKDDILELMVEVAVGTVSPDLDTSAPWQEQLRVTMLSFYDTLVEHYVLIEMLVNQRATIGPALFRARDAALARISEIPLPPLQAYGLFNLLGSMIVGAALVEGSPVARADRFGSHRLHEGSRETAAQAARRRVSEAIFRVIEDQGTPMVP